MIETIIILSILLVVLITYVIIMHLSFKKVIEKEKENAVGSFFASILSGGYEKRVNDTVLYCVLRNIKQTLPLRNRNNRKNGWRSNRS